MIAAADSRAMLAAASETAEMTDLSVLYRRYAPDVFRFALYLCGDKSEAEDITAETFVRVWTSPERVEMATVKGYLFTIARNLFLQERRKRWRRADLPEREISDREASPHERAERRSELQAVLAGMERLPEVDRAALLMRAVEGMPYAEIARALDISLAAAKVKVHRARLALAGIRQG